MKRFFRQILLTAACFLLTVASFAQKKSAHVSGKVVDENENPLLEREELAVTCHEHLCDVRRGLGLWFGHQVPFGHHDP